MFCELADGSAVVYGISVRPFVQLQHMQIDVTTINRLANYSLSFARERGYLQTDDAISRATRFAESNDARPLVEQEGYAHRNEDRTVFYAGVDVQLSSKQPHFHRPAIPSTVMLLTKLYISNVGRSSYNVKGTLYTYVEDEVTNKQHYQRCNCNIEQDQEEQQEEEEEGRMQISEEQCAQHKSEDTQHQEQENLLQMPPAHKVNICNSVRSENLQNRALIPLPIDITELGQFLFTCVRVSSVLRAPVPLSPRTREVLVNHCRLNTTMVNHKNEKTECEWKNCASTMARIDVRAHVARSKVLDMNAFPEIVELFPSLLACQSCQKKSEASNVASCKENAIDETVQNDVYCRSYTLRESDMDFNKHVNQLATMHMVINTFRSALRDKCTIYNSLLAEDVSYLIGDLLLRRLHIDYVREIPFTDIAMEIYLFPMSTEDLNKIKCTREHARLNELAAIGFFTVGVSDSSNTNLTKEESKQHKYISTVGKLTTPVENEPENIVRKIT